jgi:tetratricopeptide (TPR) repeat protein
VQQSKNTETPKPYSNNIRHCIKKQGYTIQEVANETGIPRRTLTNYISGEAPIPRTYLEKIAYTIGCDTQELLQQPPQNMQPSVVSTATPLDQMPTIVTLTDELKNFLTALLKLDGDLLTQNQRGSSADLSRRIVLQEFLGLLRVAFAFSHNQPSYFEQEQNSHIINEDLMVLFESTMPTYWELYHTGGAVRVAQKVEWWTKEIAKLTKIAQGTVWHQRLLVLLTIAYQLQSCVSRDMMNYTQANIAYQKAFHIAQELDDVELMASTLARHGVTLIQQARPKDAIIYLSGALDIIDAERFPHLKGHTLQALAEAYAKDQKAEESWSTIGQAETYLRKKEQTQERSLIRGVTVASIAAQKGINAVLLHDYQTAITLIDQSLTTYDPALIRGRARLIAQKAEAYYGLGIMDACTNNALAALSLARSAGSEKTEDRIKTLFTNLAQSSWRKEQSVAQLGEALS